ncbi:MAG: hypothetical protein M0P17_05510 [Methanoculleus sp.]|nr:hypothetical protein [Methanoculleus sp.]
MDAREREPLTLDDMQQNCMFEIVILFKGHDPESDMNIEFKIFAKAWRKPIKPFTSLDNSAYSRKDKRNGEWTLQFDSYEWRGAGWDRYIEENRSDGNMMKNLNIIMRVAKKYPESESFFFSQEYADRERDSETYPVRISDEEHSILSRAGYRHRLE